MKATPLEFLDSLKNRILNENVTELSMGSMLFDQDGVRFTEDIEDEYVPSGSRITFVETPYAQQLSWVVRQFQDGLFDIITYYDKSVFYGKIAESANACIARTDDRTALLFAALEEATLMTVQALMFKNQDMRDEVLACVASLSDVAEKA